METKFLAILNTDNSLTSKIYEIVKDEDTGCYFAKEVTEEIKALSKFKKLKLLLLSNKNIIKSKRKYKTNDNFIINYIGRCKEIKIIDNKQIKKEFIMFSHSDPLNSLIYLITPEYFDSEVVCNNCNSSVKRFIEISEPPKKRIGRD